MRETFRTIVLLAPIALIAPIVLMAPAFAIDDSGKHDDKRDRDLDVNATQPDGMTALHRAAYLDDTEAARRLIDAGAAVDVENRYGVRPLSLACANGNGALVALLLESGADPNATCSGGEMPLMTAARTGRVGPVAALVASGAEIDARERRGQTAVMWAAAEGHAEVVRFLLDAGADRSIRLRSGFTAMFFAVRQGRIEVVKTLLAAGDDVNEALRAPRRDDERGRAPSDEGTSALVLAIENAHFELALELLKAGADPNDERSGIAPLHAIVGVRRTSRGDDLAGRPPPPGSGTITSLQLVRELVARGADVNRRLKRGGSGAAVLSKKGATAFLLAAHSGDLAYQRLLLELGADPTIPNAENSTPFIAAAGLGVRAPGEEPASEPEAIETLRLLLKLGNDINAVDVKGETAMHAAAYKNAPNIVRFLAESGASIDVWNRKNKHGWTPLVIAEGFRPGNYKPSPATVAAIHEVMREAGMEPPPPTPRPERKPKRYEK